MNSVKKHFLGKSLIIAFFVLGTVCAVRAQSPVKPTPTPNPCPTITVSSSDSVTSGSPVTFTVDISDGDAKVKPTFSWTVSASEISGGQGTSSITVPTTGLAIDTAITGTVEIVGYEQRCSLYGSSTTMIVKKP